MKTSRWVIAGIAAALISLSGCGAPVGFSQRQTGSMMGQGSSMMGQGESMMQGKGAPSVQSQQSDNSSSSPGTSGSASSNQGTAKNQHIYLTVLPEAKLGSDGKLHDIFSPADFIVHPDTPVTVTVYNYDTGEHSFTAQALGVNKSIKGAQKKGVPAITTFTFTAKKTGAYTWACIVPCDDNAGGWAMSHDGFMTGQVSVTAD